MERTIYMGSEYMWEKMQEIYTGDICKEMKSVY